MINLLLLSRYVMISDNVATTIEYIDKTGDQKFTSDKIIDNIFRIRMDKVILMNPVIRGILNS